MWTRAELKGKAKAVLRGNYWMALAAGVIYLVLASGISFVVNYQTQMDPYATGNGLLQLVNLLWSVFIGLPLFVGLCYFFIRGREQDTNLVHLLAPFKRGYAHSLVAMFLMYLFIGLWSLLLLIPGIIKSYAYRMVPWLIAEYPEMAYSQAFAISKDTTRGEKWNIFVLDLSFIGWYLLCALTLGLGMFFLFPYLNATYAELYAALKQKAISQGVMVVPKLATPPPEPPQRSEVGPEQIL